MGGMEQTDDCELETHQPVGVPEAEEPPARALQATLLAHRERPIPWGGGVIFMRTAHKTNRGLRNDITARG